MTSQQNKEILQCHTAKFKHAEAMYFLDQMRTDKIWHGHVDIFDFFLNSFVVSANSIIDYVHSDFVLHTIRPLIDWQEWNNATRKKDGLKDFIYKHPKKIALQRFQKQHNKEIILLMKNPIVNYFRIRRNEIVHNRWHGTKFASFTEYADERDRVVNERHLENEIALQMYRTKNIPISTQYFSNIIQESDRDATLERLASEPMLDICKEYLEILFKFIGIFEGKNYFK